MQGMKEPLFLVVVLMFFATTVNAQGSVFKTIIKNGTGNFYVLFVLVLCVAIEDLNSLGSRCQFQMLDKLKYRVFIRMCNGISIS